MRALSGRFLNNRAKSVTYKIMEKRSRDLVILQNEHARFSGSTEMDFWFFLEYFQSFTVEIHVFNKM